MSKSWPLVALGEVLRKSEESVPLDPNKTYREVTIKLWGKGVVLRREASGSEIAAPRRSVVRAGQFILSRIDARNGAFGIVPPALDGAVVSNDFPSFNLNTQRIVPKYLGWLSRTENFVDLCKSASEGTTNRVRLKEEKFLATSIALPSLEEQQRIVVRIEELTAKVEEAQKVRQQATEEAESVYQSFLTKVMETNHVDWTRKTIGDVIVSMDAGWSPQCDERPANADEWGVLRTTSVQWCEFRQYENKLLPSSLTPRPELSVEVGDVLVTRAGPRKRVGVVAAVRDTARNLMISDKLIRLRPDQSKLLPRFLELAIASPFSQEHLVNRKTGLADAQVNISQAILRRTPISYPSLEEQSRIVDYLDDLQTKVGSLKRLQTETSAELQAMLPSILTKVFQGTL